MFKNSIFPKILNEFYKKDKYKFYILYLMSIIAGIFEFIGLILIFRFILFLLNPDSEYSVRIFDFFNNNLKIFDYPKICLLFGVAIAFIYIFKNVYMLFFTKLKNYVLEDLSVKITLTTINNILCGNYLLVNSIPSSDKLDILNKITIVVWEYCLKYVNFISNVIVAVILLFYLFLKFTFCAVVSFIIISILSSVEYIYLKKCSSFQNKNYASCLNNISSNLLNIIDYFKEIKLNNSEEYFCNASKKTYKKFASLNKDRAFNNVFHVYFTEISIMLTFCVVLYVLFLTSNFDNKILITSITTICVSVIRLAPVINRAQSAIYYINSNKKTAIEVLDFNNKFKNKIQFDSTREKLNFTDSIELKNICFKYGNDKGLNNINLKINKGDFIGITGQNGCYKTTLALMLSGLIKPLSGDILVDNNLLKEYRKWQNNIAFLNQDFKIIFDDIYKNISFEENYNKNLIDEILKELNLDELINQKSVSVLSQGQKQRLAFAFVLYRLRMGRDLLILDEASSSFDIVLENKISEILKNLKGKKTIISVAHRLQILKHCTKIIYMEDGKIIDCGSFDELKENNSKFRELIKLSNV